MSDFLRKGFLLGLGAAVSGKERLERMLSDLVEKNELTSEQAKTVMHNFIEKGEMKKEEWSTKQYEKTQDTASDLGLATQEELNELRSRVAVLEEKLNEN